MNEEKAFIIFVFIRVCLCVYVYYIKKKQNIFVCVFELTNNNEFKYYL